VFPKHYPRARKDRIGQGIERTSRQKQLGIGLFFEIVVLQLKDFSLLNESGR
jgi:hypothetical protein